jgi:hypothetical protein
MSRLREQARTLVCPGCGRAQDAQQRFCPDCGLPLVFGDSDDARPPRRTDIQRQARLIKPQLTEGELVRIAGARNQTEAEFIQGLLLEEGVPSILRRSAGFDVPDMLAAGPRDILVAASARDTAREVLMQADIAAADARPAAVSNPYRLLAGLLIALAVGCLVIGLVAVLTR